MQKISVVSALGAFLSLSMLSPAQTAAATTSAGTMLGSLEGAFNFCSKVNPQAAPKYKLFDQLLTNGESAKAIAQVRNSDAYEDAYQQISRKLKALPAREALAVCSVH
jgi:hypothetical protein